MLHLAASRRHEGRHGRHVVGVGRVAAEDHFAVAFEGGLEAGGGVDG